MCTRFVKTNSRCYFSISANFLRFCGASRREREKRESARERGRQTEESEMAREIDTWSNRTTEVGTSCEKEIATSPFHQRGIPKTCHNSSQIDDMWPRNTCFCILLPPINKGSTYVSTYLPMDNPFAPIVPTNHALVTTYILAIYMHVLSC
jgi:hypothetical protein